MVYPCRIRTTRKTILQQLAQHRPHKNTPLQVLIDLTTLEKCGKFLHLSNPTDEPETPDPWARILNGKRGLHIVMLYLMIGEWRVPWSFRIWRGTGYASPSQLACKLLATVPVALSQHRRVIVLADTEFGTVGFLHAVRKRSSASRGRDALQSSDTRSQNAQTALPPRTAGATSSSRWHD